MQGKRYRALGLLFAALAALPARAADHRDGPAATADPSTDINDVYAWMAPDGGKVYLAMTVFPFATSTSKFSNSAYYVFHTASRASFLATQLTATDVTCLFDEGQRVQCWAGADRANYVSGDASVPVGISSKNAKVRVFAGLRDDPFFFNLDGFNEVRTAVKGATLTLDGNGCPTLDPTTATSLTTQLQRGKKVAGMADLPLPGNAFGRANTLAIVLELDKTLLSQGGPILSVWAGTHKKK